MRSPKVVLSALILAIAGTAGVVSADAFTAVNLGQAGPGGLDLGIFVTGPTTINASNSGTAFNTNMGLGPGASTNFSGGGTLTGTLYYDTTATLQSNLSSQFNVLGGTVKTPLSTAVNDVKTAASNAAALPASPSETFASIGGSPLAITDVNGTLNGLGGRNTVVDVTGNIDITNPANDLTISGGANDFYIINVGGSVTVTNGQIAALGGIPASHILFNVEGTGNSVNLSNGTSVLTGTYLAPNVNQKITISPGTVNGAIIGYEIQTSSGPTVNGPPFGGPLPLPSALWGMPALLGLLAIRRFQVRETR